MKLLIMRHADTEWSKMGFLSYTDIGLSDAGRQRAEEAAKNLSGSDIESVVTSPLARASETAGIIGSALGVSVKCDKRLEEVNFGIFEGLSREEAREKFPSEFSARESDKWNYAVKNGESYRDASRRVVEFMGTLRERKTLAVTHATLMKVFFVVRCGISLKDAERELIEPCSCFGLEGGACKRLL